MRQLQTLLPGVVCFSATPALGGRGSFLRWAKRLFSVALASVFEVFLLTSALYEFRRKVIKIQETNFPLSKREGIQKPETPTSARYPMMAHVSARTSAAERKRALDRLGLCFNFRPDLRILPGRGHDFEGCVSLNSFRGRSHATTTGVLSSKKNLRVRRAKCFVYEKWVGGLG